MSVESSARARTRWPGRLAAPLLCSTLAAPARLTAHAAARARRKAGAAACARACPCQCPGDGHTSPAGPLATAASLLVAAPPPPAPRSRCWRRLACTASHALGLRSRPLPARPLAGPLRLWPPRQSHPRCWTSVTAVHRFQSLCPPPRRAAPRYTAAPTPQPLSHAERPSALWSRRLCLPAQPLLSRRCLALFACSLRAESCIPLPASAPRRRHQLVPTTAPHCVLSLAPARTSRLERGPPGTAPSLPVSRDRVGRTNSSRALVAPAPRAGASLLRTPFSSSVHRFPSTPSSPRTSAFPICAA